jgi:RNA polymerase sigma-70 factor (ECF subfamily)
MAADKPNSLTGFPLAGSVSAATESTRSSRLEDEVVALFDQLRAPVLRYLLSFGICVPDAEEIVQEVFLALFQHLRQKKSRVNLQGWVFRVAHNSALKQRLRARRESDRFSYVPEILARTEDLNPGPEESVASGQRQQRLLAVVRALPEQDQCCLSLRAEGLRYREIAEVLGISLGSVAASLEKSLSRLTRAEQI